MVAATPRARAPRSYPPSSTNTNGTNGDYNYFGTPNFGPTNSAMPVFRDISLPTFSDSYGQLDFGASYRPTENLSVSLDFRNLLDEISRTYTTGYSNGKNNRYHEKAPRSWFVSDRRATLGVRYKF